LTKEEILYIIVIVFAVTVILGLILLCNHLEDVAKSPRVSRLSGPTYARTAIPPITKPTWHLKWSYDSFNLDDFIPHTVSMGGDGGQIFTLMYINPARNLLFSSYDNNDRPIPLIDYSGDLLVTLFPKAASSKNSDIHVSLAQEAEILDYQDVIVRKFETSSVTPDWEKEVFTHIVNQDFTGLSISDDGEIILVTIYDMTNGKVYLITMDNEGNVIYEGHAPTLGGFYGDSIENDYKLSGDGSTIILRTPLKATIRDIYGNILDSIYDISGFNTHALSMSFDGSRIVLVFGNSLIKTFDKNLNNDYVESRIITLSQNDILTSTELSEDGNTLVYSYYNMVQDILVIQAVDITNGVTELMRKEYSVPGTLINQVRKISINSDGSRFAAGLWGDEQNSVPELLVFDVNQNEPIAEMDLYYDDINAGVPYHNDVVSVIDLEISPDGTKVVVAHKGDHANNLAGGGKIQLYEYS